ncbi:unnamed protein product, partial [Gongylonema pulchrum]|uniref:RPN2_C domain-containing protein n=1 Tax=Gongylonema pulchrum TaxID=637853 RepID=A0A183DHD1_9BILA
MFALSALHLDSDVQGTAETRENSFTADGDKAKNAENIVLPAAAPSNKDVSGKQQSLVVTIPEKSEMTENIYVTPPTSPEPIYVHEGMPSKEDEELAMALSLASISIFSVEPELLSHFGAV